MKSLADAAAAEGKQGALDCVQQDLGHWEMMRTVRIS